MRIGNKCTQNRALNEESFLVLISEQKYILFSRVRSKKLGPQYNSTRTPKTDKGAVFCYRIRFMRTGTQPYPCGSGSGPSQDLNMDPM